MYLDNSLPPAGVAVFYTVLTQGPVSRRHVARHLGLSMTMVAKVTRPLIDAGYLEELPDKERTGPGAGRPASPLAVRTHRERIAGIKVTVNELTGVTTDLTAQIREEERVPLPSCTVHEVIAGIGTLLDKLGGGITRLGLSVPGDVDRRAGLVRHAPMLGWHDVPLGDLVATITRLPSVSVENDVKALTASEHWFGVGVGATSLVLVTVGTGIGCGLILGGSPLGGAYGVAGELGHATVELGGKPCYCGGSGCLETIASTDAIVSAIRQQTGEAHLTLEQAVAHARSGDAAAREVFEKAANAVGVGISTVANLLGPEQIVVTGEGLAAARDLMEPAVRTAFATQTIGSAARARLTVRETSFPDWARGAAVIAIQDLITTSR
ncbi:ROK family protein [Nonomuraea diastatica]|uniref:ROK family protein n=1 Tax=Nonomuraea diastatica TaxID=1848329 RepID=A0A4R4WJT4_9ACTN|nr:ROK family protein [Nonomuraea diastatica]TDD15895.1 ROK family protein [Nonomuraea diastatica]